MKAFVGTALALALCLLGHAQDLSGALVIDDRGWSAVASVRVATIRDVLGRRGSHIDILALSGWGLSRGEPRHGCAATISLDLGSNAVVVLGPAWSVADGRRARLGAYLGLAVKP